MNGKRFDTVKAIIHKSCLKVQTFAKCADTLLDRYKFQIHASYLRVTQKLSFYDILNEHEVFLIETITAKNNVAY